MAANNEPAQALYRRFGFAPVGVRKNYYPVTGQDALVMWVYDIDSEEYARRLDELARRSSRSDTANSPARTAARTEVARSASGRWLVSEASAAHG